MHTNNDPPVRSPARNTSFVPRHWLNNSLNANRREAGKNTQKNAGHSKRNTEKQSRETRRRKLDRQTEKGERRTDRRIQNAKEGRTGEPKSAKEGSTGKQKSAKKERTGEQKSSKEGRTGGQKHVNKTRTKTCTRQSLVSIGNQTSCSQLHLDFVHFDDQIVFEDLEVSSGQINLGKDVAMYFIGAFLSVDDAHGRVRRECDRTDKLLPSNVDQPEDH
jgi:hypothetical protein